MVLSVGLMPLSINTLYHTITSVSTLCIIHDDAKGVNGGKLGGDALEPLAYIVLEISLWYQIVSTILLTLICYIPKCNIGNGIFYVTIWNIAQALCLGPNTEVFIRCGTSDSEQTLSPSTKTPMSTVMWRIWWAGLVI